MNELAMLNNKFNVLKEKFHSDLCGAYDDEGIPSAIYTLNVLVDTMDELLTLLSETVRR